MLLKKEIKISLIINIAAAVIFVGILTYCSIKYTPQLFKYFHNPQLFAENIKSYGFFGFLIFEGINILQVIIAIIPGEFVQIAAGYIYGTLFGTLCSTIGILIGTVLVFYSTRILGYNLVKAFVSEKSLEKYHFLINNPKAEIILGILFLIPGMPKDMLVYLAGLTPIKPIRFFILSMVGRLPGMFISAYAGSHLHSKDYTSVIVIAVIAALIFFMGVLFRDKIFEKLGHKKKM
jgi:uncharacterized membrane protein YdjX (TVP38/TMEM64 family)